MSILYNDGDREDGAKPQNIRRVGPSRADAVKTPSVTQQAPEKPVETPPLPAPSPPTDTAATSATQPPIAAATPAATTTPASSTIATTTVSAVSSDALKPIESTPQAAAPAVAVPPLAVTSTPSATAVPSAPAAPPASDVAPPQTSMPPSQFALTHTFGVAATPAPAAAPHSALPSARSTPARAPLSESQLFGTPLPVAAANVSTSSFAPAPISLAHLGRLARELAAVRVRARPAISDAFAAQAAARSMSTSGARSVDGRSDGAPLTAAHVAAWVVGALARAQARVGGAATVQLSAEIEAVGTTALREGLLACGFSTSTESLAVLRSAFRARPELGAAFLFPLPTAGATKSGRSSPRTGARERDAEASSSGSGAAILVGPLVSFLVGDDAIAAEILKRVDDMALRRSGSGRTRPPSAPAPQLTPLPWELGAGSVAASVVLGGSAATSASLRGLVTPQRTALSASVLDAPRAAATLHAPLTNNVREWLRTRATDEERQNLVALMGLIADFQTRNKLPVVAVSSASDGSDSVVVPLGNTLKVGLRVYT